MISSILSAITIFALTCGKMNIYVCGALSLTIAAFVFAWRKKHSHGTNVSIDYHAQCSKLNSVNAGVKMVFAICMLVLVVASSSAHVGVFAFVTMSFITLVIGKTKPAYYASAMFVPGVFILLSAITLTFEIGSEKLGYIDINLFGGYLSITRQSQQYATDVILKAFGAISCLYMLNLSTPMSEMISALARAKFPAILIELLFLIYRYIFIVIEMLASMHTATKSRLGDARMRARLASFLATGSTLLVRSLKRARNSFDAMEARCYDGKIEFLSQAKRVKMTQVFAMSGVCVAALAILIFAQWGVI